MTIKIATLSVLIAVSGAACATAGAGDEMSEEVAARLAEFEPTGETLSCISVTRIQSIDALDEHRFLVRTSGRDYYLNEVSGRCGSAGRAGYYLQYSTSTGQLCRNEIVRVVDNSNGFTAGSCGLGSFQELVKKPVEAE